MIALDHFWLLAAALVVDAIVGDPDVIWRRLPHPVAMIGGLVRLTDRALNRAPLAAGRRRFLGALATGAIVLAAALAGFGLARLFAALPYGEIGTIIVAAIMLAGRALNDHVAAVATAFDEGIAAARAAVARIVGREPGSLDRPRIARAAIESSAENFSDGVVAPAIWFLALGLPGLLAYKAVNTADSMIGHLTPRYLDFGWAAARLDDLVNWPASRLAGGLIALAAPLAGGAVGDSFRAMRTEAPKHRSPNAGWPEAAMAAALGVALAGPRRYAGIIVDDPFLNPAGRRDAGPADIRRALRVYRGANAFLFGAIALTALALWL